MRSLFKKAGIATLGALSLIGATLAASSSAEARYYGRGWGGRLGRPGHRRRSGSRRLGGIASLLLRRLRWLRLLRRRLYPEPRGRLHRLRPSDRPAGQRLLLSDPRGGVGGPGAPPQKR